MAKNWITDAARFVINDVQNFRDTLLYETPSIEDFLSDSTREVIAVAASKGFGKTLLLMCKRLALVAKPGVRFLPSNSLVDKPALPPPNFSQLQVRFISARNDFWSFVWSLSFVIAAIRAHPETAVVTQASERVESPLVKKIFKDSVIENPSDVFKRLLEFDVNEYDSLRNDHNRLVPAFRQISSAVFIFLDNIDEFFDDYLKAHLNTAARSQLGEFDPKFWYDAQIGALQAAKNLSSMNHHVRIYCAIRKEALDTLSNSEPQTQQIKAACADLSYTHADLRAILERNIQAEQRLADPNAADLFVRWVGPDSVELEHGTTLEKEHIADYIIRHTLGRPRDIASVGRSISEISASERNAASIKRAVNKAASELVKSYIGECRLHIPYFDPDALFPLISKNVQTHDEIKQSGAAYVQMQNRRNGSAELTWKTVFSMLHRMGLLGYVGKRAGAVNDVQLFHEAGTQALIGPSILPLSERYLAHPALSDYIAAEYHPAYLRNANRMNIIGYDRVWRSDTDGYFVAIGDVVNSSEFIGTEKEAPFSDKFNAVVQSEAHGLLRGWVEGGDKVVLIDQSPQKLLARVLNIWARINEGDLARDMRFGVDYGFVSVSQNPHGQALRRASRIETICEPSTAFATEAFYQHLTKQGSTPFAFVLIGQRNVAKESEETEHHMLYRLDLMEPRVGVKGKDNKTS